MSESSTELQRLYGLNYPKARLLADHFNRLHSEIAKLRANRWSAFSDEELHRIRNDVWEGQWSDKLRLGIVDEIEAELTRRAKQEPK